MGSSSSRLGDRLRVDAPRGTLTDELRQVLTAYKPELLALLTADESEVVWRMAAMRPQVPRRGPIAFLVARWVVGQSGGCLSCGEPLPEDRSYRCRLCAEAAWRVLHEEREQLGREGTK